MQNFNEELQQVFRKLLDIYEWPYTRLVNGDLEILIEDMNSYRQILILKQVQDFPKGKQDYFCPEIHLSYQKETNTYCLYGKIVDEDDEEEAPFEIKFVDAEVKMELFNCANSAMIWSEPFDLLSTMCFDITKKAECSENYCNALERELLPLIKEIASLQFGMMHMHKEVIAFPHLQEYARKYGQDKMIALLKKLEKTKISDKQNKYYSLTKKVTSLFSKQACEPLWRDLYKKIVASQIGYPNKVEQKFPLDLLETVRQKIQKQMESYGYSGTYPNFTKTGNMPERHIKESYGNIYLIGNKENVQYHIHCAESLEDEDMLAIQFLCGTAFLRKKEFVKDAYGCIFDAKGSRLFDTVYYLLGEEREMPELAVTVAVKKAECIKLAKEEKQIHGGKHGRLRDVCFLFFFLGGIFSVLGTLIGMIVWITITLICEGYSDFWQLLGDMHWGWLFIVHWLIAGGWLVFEEFRFRR